MPPSQNPEIPNKGAEVQPIDPGIEAQSAPIAPEAAPTANTDASAQSASAQQPVQLPQFPNSPIPPASGSTVVSGAVSAIPANPVIADDVDVIEKEWVDQADKIIEQTKGDPYMEEEAIESLQIDYLKKRYGHDVKKSDQKT